MSTSSTPDPSVRALIAQRAITDRDKYPWRYYKFSAEDQRAWLDKHAARIDELEANLAKSLAILADLEAEMRRFAEANKPPRGFAEVAEQALAWAERLKALREAE